VSPLQIIGQHLHNGRLIVNDQNPGRHAVLLTDSRHPSILAEDPAPVKQFCDTMMTGEAQLRDIPPKFMYFLLDKSPKFGYNNAVLERAQHTAK
jgi:hypothetical protein